MEDDEPQVSTAIDAVRCLYLARMARQKGDEEAAERWDAHAKQWMNRIWGDERLGSIGQITLGNPGIGEQS